MQLKKRKPTKKPALPKLAKGEVYVGITLHDDRLREAALAAVQSCECTLRERDSGHRVGCFAPELAEALAATRQESSNG